MKKIFILLLVIGLGWIYNINASEPETPKVPQNYVQVTCPSCGGSGTVVVGYNAWGYPILQACGYCGGRGWVVVNQTNNSNPSFRGKNCKYTEGCDCSGFVRITDGEEWEKAYCKRCGHHEKYHKK